jgi:protein-disulfide isomerase
VLAAGAPRGLVYETLTARGKATREADAPSPPPPVRAPATDDDRLFQVSTGAAPSRGPADAKVVIVEWADFQCPFCQRAEATLARLGERFPHDVRFVWKHQPLPFHPIAQVAAETAVEAQAQGRFWEFHDRMLKAEGSLDATTVERVAREAGVDGARLGAAIADHRHAARVAAEAKEGTALEATGTPTFFINGKRLVGAQPYAVFEQRVEKALAEIKATK